MNVEVKHNTIIVETATCPFCGKENIIITLPNTDNGVQIIKLMKCEHFAGIVSENFIFKNNEEEGGKP